MNGQCKSLLIHVKGEGNENTPLKVGDMLKLIPASQLRDLVVAEIEVNDAIPSEVVPAFEGLSRYANNMKTYRSVFERLVKSGDMIKEQDTCPTCNGVGKSPYNSSFSPIDCWNCKATGFVTRYKWIGCVT